ncbi:CHAT domain-containing protein [Suillus paluster]|uniref:CHAT domain-containing protein n=1 Tax=Suillus paluster TaxID=48578 RepID=UPI001B870633|nr:CHAT domain-containing protein [Suillus paluster]KAG1753593.1 CHAT domain-containing protein [Suillus paluster]
MKCFLHDTYLHNLGVSLQYRFDHQGASRDLNRAISLCHEPLTVHPPGHQLRDITLYTIALALKTRFVKLHSSDDLNEAIGLYRESKQHDDPERHKYLFSLSSALRSRFMQTQKDEDVEYLSYMWLKEAYLSRYEVQHNPAYLSLAVENFRLVSRHPTQGFLANRIIQAYNWTVTAEWHSHTSALEAYTTFFELLDGRLATRSSTISRRELEATVTFYDSRTLPVDAASSALHRHNLVKVVKLVEQGRGQRWSLASRLRTPVEDPKPANPKLAHRFSMLGKRISDVAQGCTVITDRAAVNLAARKYRRLLMQWEAAVAEIRTVEGFLLPPSYEDLRAAAAWLSHHPYRNEAPLSNLAVSNCSLYVHPSRMKADGCERGLCLEDIYVCSYTPTLSALIRSRQTMETHAQGKGRRLPLLTIELAFVHKFLPPNIKFTRLSGDKATQAGALEALRCNSWVHLACHGKQDHEQPYSSRFAMRDKPLALLAITENNAPHAEFAFLSACHTAVGDDEKTTNGVIHPAAGLQFSGFKSVVGTLWAVDDAVAKHVVEAFYENVFKDLKDPEGVLDCTKAALALNHATYAMKNNAPLEQMLAFIHIGV